MKNKFTKKHKHVLIINGTQGMAMLSLAVISRVCKYLKSSAPCARLLSSFDSYRQKNNQSSADSASCARALSRLWTGFGKCKTSCKLNLMRPSIELAWCLITQLNDLCRNVAAYYRFVIGRHLQPTQLPRPSLDGLWSPCARWYLQRPVQSLLR